MAEVAQNTVVVDKNAGIDDTVLPYPAFGLDYGSCKDNRAFLYPDRRVNAGPGVDYRDPFHIYKE